MLMPISVPLGVQLVGRHHVVDQRLYESCLLGIEIERRCSPVPVSPDSPELARPAGLPRLLAVQPLHGGCAAGHRAFQKTAAIESDRSLFIAPPLQNRDCESYDERRKYKLPRALVHHLRSSRRGKSPSLAAQPPRSISSRLRMVSAPRSPRAWSSPTRPSATTSPAHLLPSSRVMTSARARHQLAREAGFGQKSALEPPELRETKRNKNGVRRNLPDTGRPPNCAVYALSLLDRVADCGPNTWRPHEQQQEFPSSHLSDDRRHRDRDLRRSRWAQQRSNRPPRRRQGAPVSARMPPTPAISRLRSSIRPEKSSAFPTYTTRCRPPD